MIHAAFYHNYNLMSQKIIITGASSGIGKFIALEFAKMGWMVGIAARNESALDEIKNKFPDNIKYLKIDVTEDDAPAKLLTLIDRLGGMDVYFHVSGILYENPVLDINEDLHTVETNVAGFTRMIDTAFHYFTDSRQRGKIAAITSVAGTKGIADLASYSASKRYQWTYLQALDQLARREKLPISFTDIRPGWTRTPLIDPNRSYMLAMKADKVARKAVKAILYHKRIAYIDCRWSILARLWRVFPSSLWTRIPLKI